MDGRWTTIRACRWPALTVQQEKNKSRRMVRQTSCRLSEADWQVLEVQVEVVTATTYPFILSLQHSGLTSTQPTLRQPLLLADALRTHCVYCASPTRSPGGGVAIGYGAVSSSTKELSNPLFNSLDGSEGCCAREHYAKGWRWSSSRTFPLRCSRTFSKFPHINAETHDYTIRLPVSRAPRAHAIRCEVE